MLFFPIHAGAWTVQNEIRNDRTSISLQWVQTSFAGCFESLPSSVSVSYTHLDVYKRQLLPVFRSVITISGKDGNIFDVSGVFTCLLYTSRCV